MLIVGLARTGDRDAFSELVRRRQSWLRQLLRQCCGNAALADDLAQQTFLQAYREIGRLREPRRFGTWLSRIAINVWRQHARRNDVLRDSDSDALAAQRATSERPALALDLDAALAELPAAVRECVVLCYHAGLSHGDVATATGLPLGTVKSHIRRGAMSLRERLSAYRETEQGEARVAGASDLMPENSNE